MTAKSILEIEVQDAAFKRFLELFKDYERLLGSIPDEWKKINDSLRTAAETFAGSAASVQTIASALSHAAEGQDRLERGAARAVQPMRTLAGFAGSIAGHITSIAKWTGIGGLLMGGAGLFGMDRLAHSMFAQSRMALGLGVSTGEMNAFAVNFRRVVDPESLLANVANARNDLAQQWAFRTLGISPEEQGRLDNADLAREVMRRAREMWRTGPQTLQYAQARGLTMFFSLEELRRLGAMSDTDFRAAQMRYGQDRRALTLPEDVQRQWVMFATQLRRAGISIEATFIKGLAPLAQPLEKLSDSVTRAIAAFLNSEAVRKGINYLADALGSPQLQAGIDHFINWLGSPAFRQDLDDLTTAISTAVHKIGDVLRWFGVLPSSPTTETEEQRRLATGETPPTNMSAYSSFKDWQAHNIGFAASVAKIRSTIEENSGRYGVPPDLMWNLFGAETSFGRDFMVSPSGARGWFQLMPSTAGELGVDPWDPGQSTIGAMTYLRQLYERYHDWRKAIAAYNWGPKRLDEDLRLHGADWEKFLPDETKRELSVVFPSGGAGLTETLNRLRKQLANGSNSSNVRVQVTNDTSARVAITGAQLAQ